MREIHTYMYRKYIACTRVYGRSVNRTMEICVKLPLPDFLPLLTRIDEYRECGHTIPIHELGITPTGWNCVYMFFVNTAVVECRFCTFKIRSPGDGVVRTIKYRIAAVVKGSNGRSDKRRARSSEPDWERTYYVFCLPRRSRENRKKVSRFDSTCSSVQNVFVSCFSFITGLIVFFFSFPCTMGNPKTL